MSAPAPVEAEGLTAGYAGRPVLRGVSWRAAPGELWAVLGPNGAGKSTLLRACLGLLRPASGAVRVFGKEASQWERGPLAKKVAWVPQRFDVDGGFTALELVLMGRSPHLGLWGLPSKQDVARAHAALAELEVDALASRPASELSGGEQRLVLLARALVQDAELLLLDEPTAFLDVKHQVAALAHARAQAAKGRTVVAVLHDVNLAAAFADRVLLLQAGAVLAAGPTHEVLDGSAVERLYGVPVSEARAPTGQRFFAPRL